MTNDPMAEIRASFFVECEELLERLQDALNAMDDGASDPETINVVFRAVHSIKGGAGAFGLDALVNFTHRFETVMDEIRNGRLAPSADAIKLFFKAADTLQDHVRAARDNEDEPAGAEDIIAAMEALLGAGAFQPEEEVEFSPMGLAFDFASDDEELTSSVLSQGEPCWRVSFTPHQALYASGNEALLILRSLSQIGRTVTNCIVPDDLPQVNEDNAEVPLLSWEIIVQGDVTEGDIRQVFDFVIDVCDVDISPILATAAPTLFVPEEEDGGPACFDQTVEELPVQQPLTDTSSLKTASQQEALPAPRQQAQSPASSQHGEPSATVRVDLDKIDRLVNLVGELVINQAMLSQSVEEAGVGHQSDVMSGLESFMTLTRDIQESVMLIRAQPVKSLFQRMGRIVREASSSVGKNVRLKTEGDYTEVDKTVIERLADPLTHMIRNAVDHGLEAPETRSAAGKPKEGLIVLSASHRSGRVMIEIEDDGAGINRPKVREIATSKGLVPADVQLSETEIDNLLFLPGFSTASEVSSLSGRGVGMDVVKSAITALGGRISINSTPGVGTKFSISLPLTLAVLDGMVVQAAGQTLVVPLSAIIETAKLEPDYIQRLSSSGDMMQIRGEFVPLFDLGLQLGFRSMRESARSGIVLLTSQDDGRRTALIVDAIMEQRQVVIKGLGQSYGNIPGVAAATILGDGQIALILDPADIPRSANRNSINDLRIAG
ncbi:MAG: chemotaxis protein CheA [Paracoccus denitrificans]|uniref:Chemotaxis protein CheA n=1 Tax=Paracoccus denitrificans TaxID=266 RepID=A0A533I6I6_PARDE|nr:MAG: chemotaxis protein CheA [Paracoccus denitrificans]